MKKINFTAQSSGFTQTGRFIHNSTDVYVPEGFEPHTGFEQKVHGSSGAKIHFPPNIPYKQWVVGTKVFSGGDILGDGDAGGRCVAVREAAAASADSHPHAPSPVTLEV